jgi:GTPase SAR1 family protein
VCLYFETSAKLDANVSRTFEEIAKQLFVGYLARRKFSEVANPKLKLSKEGVEQSQGCC